jgi:hypothetical protein
VAHDIHSADAKLRWERLRGSVRSRASARVAAVIDGPVLRPRRKVTSWCTSSSDVVSGTADTK